MSRIGVGSLAGRRVSSNVSPRPAEAVRQRPVERDDDVTETAPSGFKIDGCHDFRSATVTFWRHVPLTQKTSRAETCMIRGPALITGVPNAVNPRSCGTRHGA